MCVVICNCVGLIGPDFCWFNTKSSESSSGGFIVIQVIISVARTLIVTIVISFIVRPLI